MNMIDNVAQLEISSDDGTRLRAVDHGGHIVSWVTRDGRERLFTSALAQYGGRHAIRGGVPVIFPQFADRGPLAKHGIARQCPWVPVRSRGQDELSFSLKDSEATRLTWPESFQLHLTAALIGDSLRLTLEVRNAGQRDWSFTAALHTYLRVQDIAKVRLHGLEHCDYIDSAAGGASAPAALEALRIQGEVDRIYRGAPKAVTLEEHGPRLRIEQSGFTDVVVWNPGPEKARALSDLEANGEQQMLCIEAAVVEHPVLLAAGSSWQGTQTLTALDLSLGG